VGVVGGGGVGSTLVEFLARLGVGQLVVVDYDILKDENRNRAIGSQPRDVGGPKVDYLKRWARTIATAPHFEFIAVRGSAFEEEGVRPILDCDFVFGAADDAAARQVLDHVAYAYGIPVVDGGTTLVVDSVTGTVTGKSQVTEAGWGRPCLQCAGVYSLDEVTVALEEEHLRKQDSYIKVADGTEQVEVPRAPSVISNNGLVASIMVQRFLRTILGFPPSEGTGVQRYYVEEGQLRWGAVKGCKSSCPKAAWFGLGDGHPLPTGVDTSWRRIQREEKLGLETSKSSKVL